MAIFDAVERTLSVVKANFDADMKALVAAKVTAGALKQGEADQIDQKATIYDRLPSEVFAAHPEGDDDALGLPGVGVYSGPMTTQAKWQGKRDSRAVVVLDYFAIGEDPRLLEIQVELAAEVLLRAVDRIPEAALAGELGAGEDPNSVDVLPFALARTAGLDFYQDRVTVTFPILDQDTGL